VNLRKDRQPTAAMASTGDAPGAGNGRRQKVHIRIAYQGRGQPGPQLAERCEALVKGLALETDVGASHDRRAGNGAVDIYVVRPAPSVDVIEAGTLRKTHALAPRR